MDKLMLSLALFLPDNSLELSKKYVCIHNYEMSAAIMAELPVRALTNRYEYELYQAIIHFSLLNKDGASRHLKNIAHSWRYQEIPERYGVLAELMLEEMETWKSDDLAAIARKMQRSTDRLTTARAGPATQKIQKEIISDLDKLIKEQENALADAMTKAAQRIEQEKAQIEPQADSQIADDKGPGKIDERKLKQTGEAWGKLPPKVRAEATRELSRQMPARYRDVIENYFKRIATND